MFPLVGHLKCILHMSDIFLQVCTNYLPYNINKTGVAWSHANVSPWVVLLTWDSETGITGGNILGQESLLNGAINCCSSYEDTFTFIGVAWDGVSSFLSGSLTFTICSMFPTKLLQSLIFSCGYMIWLCSNGRYFFCWSPLCFLDSDVANFAGVLFVSANCRSVHRCKGLCSRLTKPLAGGYRPPAVSCLCPCSSRGNASRAWFSISALWTKPKSNLDKQRIHLASHPVDSARLGSIREHHGLYGLWIFALSDWILGGGWPEYG